jgi:hypothetical protein
MKPGSIFLTQIQAEITGMVTYDIPKKEKI